MKKLLGWMLVLALIAGAWALAEEWTIELIPADAVVVQPLNPEAEAVAVEEEETLSPEELSDEWWNILLLGCDSYTKNSYSRTDSMIIVSVNAAQEQVKLTCDFAALLRGEGIAPSAEQTTSGHWVRGVE